MFGQPIVGTYECDMTPGKAAIKVRCTLGRYEDTNLTPKEIDSVKADLAAYQATGLTPEQVAEMKADAASYRQIKNRLAVEGFSDLDTMILGCKQVMHDANEIGIEKDEMLELLQSKLLALRSENVQLRADRDAWKRRAEAAEEEVCRKCLRVPCSDDCEWFRPSDEGKEVSE